MKELLYECNGQKLWQWSNWKGSPEFDVLAQMIMWRQNQIRIFGKIFDEPRLTAWFGPPYKYANIQWTENPFPTELQGVLDKVSQQCNFAFNAVLCNYYRNGLDAMGWHADNEPEMNQSCIASLSLGASRTMLFKNRDTNEKISLELNNGSLLVMENMQKNWMHAIPKRKKIADPRINLTFRQIWA